MRGRVSPRSLKRVGLHDVTVAGTPTLVTSAEQLPNCFFDCFACFSSSFFQFINNLTPLSFKK